MIVQNNSATRTYNVGGVAIPPLSSKTVPDQFYDDISSITDLVVTSGAVSGAVHVDKYPVESYVDPVTGGIRNLSVSGRDAISDLGLTGARARKLAVLGDSITYQNTNGSLLITRNQGYATWATILSGGRLVFSPASNFGVSGENSTQIAARVQSAIDDGPDYCAVLAGTNDVYAGVTYAQTVANLTAIYSALVASGCVVIAVPILPRAKDAAAGSMLTAERQKIQRINNWIRRYAMENNGVIVADPTLNITDHSLTNGDPIGALTAAATAHMVDGLHPASRGAFWTGKAIADAVSSLLPPANLTTRSQIDTYSATGNPAGNLLSNGHFTGTGGTAGTGASGVLAAGWTFRRASGTTGTIVGSKVTKALDNGSTYPQQQVVCSAASGSATEGLQIYQTLSGLTIGDVIFGDLEVEVSGVSADCVRTVQLNVQDGTGTAICNAEQAGFYIPNQDWQGVLRTPNLTLAATSATMYINITVDGTVASNSITVKVGRAAIRKVGV